MYKFPSNLVGLNSIFCEREQKSNPLNERYWNWKLFLRENGTTSTHGHLKATHVSLNCIISWQISRQYTKISPRSSQLYTTNIQLPYRDYTRRKATHILREKSDATVPARSTPKRQFDKYQPTSSRHHIRRQNTTKLPRNDGRTPMSSLRFHPDIYIIKILLK
jgi:hypothetical protein